MTERLSDLFRASEGRPIGLGGVVVYAMYELPVFASTALRLTRIAELTMW
jgi:hypothetical protein